MDNLEGTDPTYLSKKIKLTFRELVTLILDEARLCGYAGLKHLHVLLPELTHGFPAGEEFLLGRDMITL